MLEEVDFTGEQRHSSAGGDVVVGEALNKVLHVDPKMRKAQP
jgi:hypothetical protein